MDQLHVEKGQFWSAEPKACDRATKSKTKISSRAAHNSCHPAAEQAAVARLSNYAIQWDVRANICSMGKVQPYLNTVFLLPSTRRSQEDCGVEEHTLPSMSLAGSGGRKARGSQGQAPSSGVGNAGLFPASGFSLYYNLQVQSAYQHSQQSLIRIRDGKHGAGSVTSAGPSQFCTCDDTQAQRCCTKTTTPI